MLPILSVTLWAGVPVNDYLSLLPATLQWISNWLASITSVPWPLWIGGVFPFYVGSVSVILWMLRGRAWPVQCSYPRTSKGWPCRNWVPGEWARCRHHNRSRRYKYGHKVVKIERWQTFNTHDEIIDRPERGVGTLRLRPSGATLLYEKGYVRRPIGVMTLLPGKIAAIWRRIKQARLRTPTTDAPEDLPHGQEIQAPSGKRTDVAEGLERVIRATQFATTAFCAATATTLLGALLEGAPETILHYLATLGFVLAWAATSAGIYARSETWLRHTCLKALKWWLSIFVPVGVLNLLFIMANNTSV